eukprot:11995534-Alexandrium_andersonii.AAC.1
MGSAQQEPEAEFVRAHAELPGGARMQLAAQAELACGAQGGPQGGVRCGTERSLMQHGADGRPQWPPAGHE